MPITVHPRRGRVACAVAEAGTQLGWPRRQDVNDGSSEIRKFRGWRLYVNALRYGLRLASVFGTGIHQVAAQIASIVPGALPDVRVLFSAMSLRRG